jgi:SAM-dependent methyltransferase
MDPSVWNEAYEGDEIEHHVDPLLVEEVADLEPGSALDLGCGAGANAVYLAEQGWKVTGVDFAPDGIRHARKLAAEKGVEAVFVAMDVTIWDPPHPYDLVVLFYAMPGGEHTAKALATASKALAPGGTLLAIDFARDTLPDGQSFFEPDELTTTDEIIAALPDLEIERAENVDVTHHFEAEEAAAEGGSGHGDHSHEPDGPDTSHHGTHEGHGHDRHASWPQGAFVRARRPLIDPRD